MRRILTFILFAQLGFSLSAQSDSIEFHFPIATVDRTSYENVTGTINFGTNLGLDEIRKASLWGRYYSDYPDHSKEELGAGQIWDVQDTISYVVLVEYDSTDGVKRVYAGDYMRFKIPAKSTYQGIFTSMVANDIYFITQSSQSFYNFDEVYRLDSEEIEGIVLQKMADEIVDLSEQLIGTMDDQDISGGLYGGMTMLTAMQAATPTSVRWFLEYVNAFPEKYRGQVWKVTETFATWAINDTPIPNTILEEKLDAATSQEDYSAIAKEYGRILTSDLILELGWVPENWAEEGKAEMAHERMDKIMRLAKHLGDDLGIGWAYFQKARVFDELGDNENASKVYGQSIPYFNKDTNGVRGLTYAYNNLAGCLDALNKQDSAVMMYESALATKRKYNDANPSESYLATINTAQKRLADAYYANSQWGEALFQYTKVFLFYETAGDYENAFDMMEDMSNSLASNGKLEEAVEFHLERINKATELGMDEVAADATFDIAYTYNGYGNEFEKAIPYYEKSYDLHMALQDTSMAALSISNVAQTYWSLKKLDLSIENHLKTIALAKAFGEKDRLANSWDKLADLYAENGNPMKSLESYDHVIELYEEMGDDKLIVTMNEVGDVYYEAKDYLKAISYYRRSAEMAKNIGDHEQSSDALFDIGMAYADDLKYDLSEYFYKESMQEAAKINYPTQEIYCLANLALIEGIRENYDKSDSLYSVALDKAELLQDNNIIAYCKYNLGYTATRKRDYETAENRFNEAYGLYEQLEDHTFMVNVLNALQMIYANRGEFGKALATIDKGLGIAKENNDRTNIGTGYNLKSDIYLRILGEFDEAWEMQNKAMDIYKEVDNSWGMASAYIGLGNIKNLQGENAAAIDFYKKSDSLYAVLASDYNRASPMNNIGTIYFFQRNYEKALEHFQKAIAILDKVGVSDASRILYVGNIGEVYLEQKRYEDSEKWISQALEEARAIESVDYISTNLVLLGKLKIETEQFKDAQKYLLEALAIQIEKGLKTHEISTRFELGKLAYLQKDESGYKYLDESISIANKMHYEKQLWEAYYYKGLVARDQGKTEEAKEYLINSIEALEKLLGAMVGGAEAKKLFSSGDKQIKVYAALVDVLILNGEVELGMQYLERSNVESLRNKFKQLKIDFKDEEAQKKLEQEKALKRKLDNLEKAIQEEAAGSSSEEKIKKLEQSKTIAENEYLKFVNVTINSNPELSRHFSGGFHPRKLKTDKNRRLIPDELVVLSYLPANDKLYIFAATADTVIAKVVEVTTDELNRNIKFLYNFSSLALGGHQTDVLRVARGDDSSPFPEEFNGKKSKYKEVSEKVFNWTIAPVKEVLDTKDRVVVIPTGMLHFLPFQMLGEQLDNGKFDFLIEHYTLFYAHSLDMLYQDKDEIEEISILAMANADKTLPAAEQEVNDLKDLYPMTDVFIHGEASEDKAKSHGGKHNILHFATHGNLDYFDYHKSYLVLAPDETGAEDGKLTIEEVWEIEDIYSYQMVTLSACKTAVTEDFNSGWAVSPATSFIDAGAPTVVASLWAVNDESTALLMKYFYRNLQDMPKVEALRRAQIELSQNKKFSHPYYWSPFILIGDWR